MTAPSQIAHYRITAKLGEGGMGAVYRGTDTKLGRDVAIKVLPPGFAEDSLRMQRFEREAQLLASLNHPNIATLYGIEQGALVMELVEGSDLAGPLPVDTVIAYARQIAAGLEAAHERGIIHRDLKPANIKVTPDGTVKLLDFGLAKVADGPAPNPNASPTLSPTISMAMTQAGMILGTAAYMAPEQARGKAVDKRADIWAFGVVVHEMLTGRQLFGGGETVSDSLAAILTHEPDWSALPKDTPPHVRRLLERCLRKDVKTRLRDIGEARIALEEAPATVLETPATPAAPRSRLWMAATAIAAAAAVALATLHFRETLAPLPVLRASFPPPSGTYVTRGGLQTVGAPALSPDGRRVAFTASSSSGKIQLWVRVLASESAQMLQGTEGAVHPFWSPDGRYLAFFNGGMLKKIDPSGGPAFSICPAPQPRGGSWGKDNVILFNPNATSPLHRVAASGGASIPVQFNGKEVLGRFPWFLPDGRHFLYQATTTPVTTAICVGSLNSSDDPKQNGKVVVNARSNPVYSDGYLLYMLESNLVAQSFDLKKLAVSGEPLAVAERVISVGAQRAGLFTAAQATLLYIGDQSSQASNLVWVDRTGTPSGELTESDYWSSPRVSHNGRSISISMRGDQWILDAETGARTRLTTRGTQARTGNTQGFSGPAPVWSPDDATVAYSMASFLAQAPEGSGEPLVSASVSDPKIVRRAITGLAQESLLFVGRYTPIDWSPDGRFLLATTSDTSDVNSRNMIWVLPLAEDPAFRKPYRLIPNAVNDGGGRFSPDGRFVAFYARDTGRPEVYITPFSGSAPAARVELPISDGGGTQPRWRKDGKEIVFLSGQYLMSAEVNLQGAMPHVAPAKRLFGPVPSAFFDMAPDGKRFLFSKPVEDKPVEPMLLIQNWPAILK